MSVIDNVIACKIDATKIMVPLLRQQKICAWPKNEKGGHVPYVPLSAALADTHHSDAHFAQYSVPDRCRRLDAGAPARIPGGVPMVLAVFDIDAAESHRASGGNGKTPAPDTWWLAELPKVEALLAAHPGLFVYRTRGGYRVVAALPEAIVIATPLDAKTWTARYLAWVAYLGRSFGICADPCKDWQRIFRSPHATREGGGGHPERREVIGNPRSIGVWICEPSEADWKEATKLDKKPEPKRRATKPSATDYAGPGVLHRVFSDRGWLGEEIETGKWAVRCPLEHEHSRGEAFDTSTVLYEPRDGEQLGYLHCSHSNCGHNTKTLRDWLGHINQTELDAARDALGIKDDPAPADWTTVLIYNDKDNLKPNVANVMAILRHHPDWRGVLAFDEFAETVVKLKDPPSVPGEPTLDNGREWTENDTRRAAEYMQRVIGLDVQPHVVLDGVLAVADEQRMHPIRDWLATLEWDGIPRADTWLIDYLGAEDSEYVRAVASKFLIGAVARVTKAPIKNDNVLILEGPQGEGKSTACKVLASPEYFVDTGITPGKKDTYENLRGVWIYEIAELVGARGREYKAIRNFLSSDTDTYRPSYERRSRKIPRQSVFVGTTNEKEYLTDPAGNRRFWPVETGEIDLPGLQDAREQLWAEARVRCEEGEDHWLDKKLTALAVIEQEAREEQDDWIPVVEGWLDGDRGKLMVSNGLTTADALIVALDIPPKDIKREHTTRMGVVLKKIGLMTKRPRAGSGEKRDRRYYWPEEDKQPAQPVQPVQPN